MVNIQQISAFLKQINMRVFLDIGVARLYYILPKLSVFDSLVFRDELNPLNVSNPDRSSIHRYNVHISLSAKYAF
jgi:hypothetical protein